MKEKFTTGQILSSSPFPKKFKPVRALKKGKLIADIQTKIIEKKRAYNNRLANVYNIDESGEDIIISS